MASLARILVTGASGFIGRHLVRALRGAFPSAVLLAATREGPVDQADQFVPMDLLDPGAMTLQLRDTKPDAVIHLAAQSAVGGSFGDPDRSWGINVDGSRALLAAMRAEVPEALLVLASTAEVYGLTFQSGIPLSEDAAMSPANPYAVSKAAIDLLAGEMALRGLRLVRLRLFNQVGPGQSEHFVVPAIARQIARAEAGLQPPALKVGALDRWRDFLDVRDGCTAFIAALERAAELPNGIAINVASAASRKIADILQSLIGRARVHLTVELDSGISRPTDVVHVAGNPARARELLGWAPVCSWDETLDLVMEDWRAKVLLTRS